MNRDEAIEIALIQSSAAMEILQTVIVALASTNNALVDELLHAIEKAPPQTGLSQNARAIVNGAHKVRQEFARRTRDVLPPLGGRPQH